MVGLANCPAAEDKPVPETPGKEPAGSSVQYLPLDAPAGMSQAVVVQGQPLVHTRQLLPLDREGKLVGEGSVDKQIEQVLNNLDAVLGASGSGLGKLVRLNVYAIAPPTVDRVREQLSKRLEPAVRPAITAVLTPLPHRKALVAVDAVAVSGRERPGRGLAALRSRGRRQGLRRRRGVAAGRCGVSVRRAGRRRPRRVGGRQVDVHPVENPRAVEALAGAGGAVEGVSEAGHVGRRGPARTEEVLPGPDDSAGGLRGMDRRRPGRDRIDRAVAG